VNTNHLFTSSSIKLNHNNSSSINKKWLRPLCQKDQKELEEWHQVFEIMEELNDSKNNQEKEEEEEQEQANKRMKKLDHLSTELKKLIQIAKSNERLKDGLTEWNAFKVLVEFMFLQQDKLPFQIECCKLMSVLVFNHDRNRIQLVTDGGVEVVLESMKKYPQEIKLQEHAAVVLTNLAHNAESNRKKIFNLGGIDMILAAMEQFPLLKSVQKRCLWALLTLAGSDWMCEGITARGGIGAILAAMLNCPSDESVQYYGSWALLNLVSGTSPESTTNVARIKNFARQEGVLEVCEAALACFPEHPGIQEKARNVLELVATQHR
jgi:myosin protein heavy chain